MRAHVQKWGNSLAVRIPRGLAAEARLRQDAPVELSLVEGTLLITPVEPPQQLQELLDLVTPENVHGEVDSGPAVGREA